MIYFICWLLSAIVGVIIGNMKGRPTAGAFWGLLLGPLGWLVMVSVLDKRPKCPECLGVVASGARKCRHCGSALEKALEASIPSRWAALVLNRTWCDCVAVLIVGLLIGWRWQAIRKSHDIADSAIQGIATEVSNGDLTFDDPRAIAELPGFDYAIVCLMPDKPPQPIAMSAYDRVTLGMKYVDVCDVFGCAGEEIGQSGFSGQADKHGPIKTVTFCWRNKDGSSVTGIFQNWRLIQKSQFGLQ